MKFETKVEQLRIQKHKGRETSDFLNDVITMAQGEPLEYLLGEVNFCGAIIDLSLRPMIPRKETEYWVSQTLEELKNKNQDMTDSHTKRDENQKIFRALDLFSGSGNVGIALLQNNKTIYVDLIEFDQKLKKQIEISLHKNKIGEERVNVIMGDVFNGARGLYDIITAVPPYVPPSMREEVMQELQGEEELSFFDKEDGYYYHKQVLSTVKEYLADGGVLYLEFDITQKEKIEELAREYHLLNYRFLADPYHHDFVFVYTK